MKRYEQYKDSGIEWIGEIPEDFQIVPLFSVASENRSKNTGNSCTNLLSLSYGKIITKDINTNDGLLPANFETYQVVEKGYTILRLTDLHNDKKSLRSGYVGERGIITSAYVGIAPSKWMDGIFLANLMHGYDVMKIFYSLGNGVRQSMNYFDLKRLPLVLPPMHIQKAINDYLNHKTASIDELIATKQKLIKLLQEKRQEIINKAVTKGLISTISMKDSGIEWIGEIPECWEIVPITKYLSSTVDYRGKTPTKVDEGVTLVTAKNIKNGKINYDLSYEYVEYAEYDEIMRRGKPQIGDVLFTTEAPLGEVANVDNERIALAQRIIKFSGNSQFLDNYYLKYWMMSVGFKDFLLSLSTGSTAEGIKASKLFQLKMPLPNIEEQQAIVGHIDRKTAKIDLLTADITVQIERLKEYRQSIVSEVVTGKVAI